jgi:hypothetical protein
MYRINEIRSGANALEPITFVEHIATASVFAESQSLGIPRGSSFGRWRASQRQGRRHKVKSESSSRD